MGNGIWAQVVGIQGKKNRNLNIDCRRYRWPDKNSDHGIEMISPLDPQKDQEIMQRLMVDNDSRVFFQNV